MGDICQFIAIGQCPEIGQRTAKYADEAATGGNQAALTRRAPDKGEIVFGGSYDLVDPWLFGGPGQRQSAIAAPAGSKNACAHQAVGDLHQVIAGNITETCWMVMRRSGSAAISIKRRRS